MKFFTYSIQFLERVPKIEVENENKKYILTRFLVLHKNAKV